MAKKQISNPASPEEVVDETMYEVRLKTPATAGRHTLAVSVPHIARGAFLKTIWEHVRDAVAQ